MQIDAIELNIIAQALGCIPDEMSLSMLRTAYSSILREVRDGATGLLDAEANILAESSLIPVHFGGLPMALRACLDQFPVGDLTPDDVFLLNDPYSGGQHAPDFIVFTPLFAGGRVVAFAGTVAHKSDVGSANVGLGGGSAGDMFGSGLIIPPIKFHRTRDWERGLLQRMVAANSRAPDEVIGDVNAQLAACQTAQLRFDEIVERFGIETITAGGKQLLDYSERRMREAIRALPSGTFYGEDVLEADADEPKDCVIRVRVTVDGDEIIVDFSDTDGQIRGARNASLASTLATAYSCVRAILRDPTIPANSGCNRPIKVIVPEGSVLNPRRPALIMSRMNTIYRAYDALLAAFAQFVPERVVAPGHNSATGMSFSYFNPERRRYQIHADLIGGGNGAGSQNDGADAVNGPLGVTLNVPVEAVENKNPHLRVLSFRLLPDSGGAGRQRGGLAVERTVLVLADGVRLGYYRGRDNRPAPGMFGGGAGALGGCIVTRGDTILRMGSRESMLLETGDVVTLTTCGGGGYGTPDGRDPKRNERDLVNGYVSSEAGASTPTHASVF